MTGGAQEYSRPIIKRTPEGGTSGGKCESWYPSQTSLVCEHPSIYFFSFPRPVKFPAKEGAQSGLNHWGPECLLMLNRATNVGCVRYRKVLLPERDINWHFLISFQKRGHFPGGRIVETNATMAGPRGWYDSSSSSEELMSYLAFIAPSSCRHWYFCKWSGGWEPGSLPHPA